ncbi:TIM barrel protein [Jannaschia sp. Os4]|uniref:TIM barrel protein n=1 Tax=Jannaschia sp. Os4 TaxID=2807617 RepID=UPI001939B63E|nr:TIM barrel protein [Jannaschia sp. Os4]MBM2576516.1 TIM barrel protein [Jannaschia sp. Os4]
MILSANTGFLYADLPFLDRIAAAASDGFHAVEFHDEWRHEAEDDLRAALRGAGLPVIGLNAAMDDGGRAAGPDRAAARADVDAALSMARALGAKAVHVLAGHHEPTPEAMDAYADTLRHATAGDGPTILIEPLSRTAKPVYPLRRIAEAAEMIERVGSPRLRAMFDLFHVAQEGDDPVVTFRAHRDRIGHVQVAHPRTRHEPEAPALAALAAAGWQGAFGCEYVPAGGTRAGLGWRDALAQG